MKKISFLMLFALLGIAGISTSLAAQESPESFLGGLFSVSADKQVRFSKGNLQCTINGTDTAWAFAAHQYDMLGTANANGSALANTIDLFGWSGSTGSAKWGISLSIHDNDYSGDFADWGQNIGDGTTWRTLTNDEWTYLHSTRANASNLMGVARINLDETGTTYANGLILLPDTWTCPEGITFKSGFSSTNSEQTYADYQTFTLEQWAKLEAAGAVFLPVSGYRNGSRIYDVQNRGYYWSATPNKSFHASYLFFHSRGTERQVRNRCFGQAVRLVQDTYTVTATCDAEQGSVSGAGTYPKGKEVTLTATAAEGYYFLQWSDGTTSNPYTFTLTQDTALTAVFAANPVYNAIVGGLFSVGEGKQVLFSAGNLQYTQSANVWAFAAHQYDVLGTANVNGSALANTIDLFGWSGNTATAKWGISLSTDNNDYSGDFADWGQNIGNGTTWRTLTHDEWTYLRSTRANAASLMGVARINLDAAGTTYANGLILLPDTWTCPEGVTFTSGFSSTDDSEQAYADYQTFTLEQWATLEASGAVFLPASGGRSGSSFYDVQHFGYYNSATPYNSGYAYSLYFVSDFAGRTYGNRSYGRAVRLVQDTYTVTATCYAEQGSVSGAGTYPNGTQVTLTATAAEHYHFVQWSNGETANPYTLTLAGDTTINAVFAIDQHTVTASGEHGSVTGAGTYDHGKEVTLEATADEHYHFVQWSNGETTNPYTFTLAGDTTITAVFALDRHTVTVSGEHGSVTGAGTYNYGAQVTLTADAEEGYHFVQWSDGSWANPYVFSLTQDIDLQAEFEAEPEYKSLSGLFSVSADKHVVFSTGNLQYAQSAEVWSFASEQYKMIGTANVHGNSTSGKIDLFGWSGSTGGAEWGISTSVSNIHYSGTFADWGEVIGDGSEWRTLTSDEWLYLHSGRAHAAQLMGVAGILLNDAGTEYVNGLVLLPDNWQCPDGVSFRSGFASENSADAYGDYQTFDLATWQVLEQSGAVFLPATGFRYGSIVGNAGSIGSYWSGSPYSTTGAYYMDIQSDGMDWYGRQRCYGHAVRLVQDYTGILYNISATCDADQGRTLGSGIYPEGTEVTIEAIPAVGYIFVRWSDGNTENPRTLLATGDISLRAEFAEDKPTQLEPTSSETKVTKIMRDGQIFIIRNQVIYDLTGRRVQ